MKFKKIFDNSERERTGNVYLFGFILILALFWGNSQTLLAKSTLEYSREIDQAKKNGDFRKVFELGKQMTKDYPNDRIGYMSLILFIVKETPQNEREFNDVEGAFKTFIEKKMAGYDDPSLIRLWRNLYRIESKFMFEKGLFEKGIGAFKRMKAIGDAGSRFSSDMMVAVEYMKQYFKTDSISFAKKAKSSALLALKNEDGLKEFDTEDNTFQSGLNFIIGCADNDMGSYSNAILYLEKAVNLEPSNDQYNKALETARSNLKGGKIKFVSIKTLFQSIFQ